VCHIGQMSKYSMITSCRPYPYPLPSHLSYVVLPPLYVQDLHKCDCNVTVNFLYFSWVFSLRLTIFPFLTLTSTLPDHSTSEVMTIRRYTNMCIIIIIIIILVTCVHVVYCQNTVIKFCVTRGRQWYWSCCLPGICSWRCSTCCCWSTWERPCTGFVFTRHDNWMHCFLLKNFSSEWLIRMILDSLRFPLID